MSTQASGTETRLYSYPQMARTYPPGYYGPPTNPGWGSYSHTPGQVMPNTYVPYPQQTTLPTPALADGLGWQWQPPPPPPPLPNHHYSPTTSVLPRHGHNSFPQRLIDTTRTPVSQLRVQSSSIHQRPVYVPSVEVMTTIALPPSRYTSTVPVYQPPAKPRTLKTGVTSVKRVRGKKTLEAQVAMLNREKKNAQSARKETDMKLETSNRANQDMQKNLDLLKREKTEAEAKLTTLLSEKNDAEASHHLQGFSI
ncbi:hypothetical protein C8R42DRAFT_723341 [Lentinula raphanica]|nr:hypothetical protein C8R42DRAFT_723341 [Lentinula raphanica]